MKKILVILIAIFSSAHVMASVNDDLMYKKNLTFHEVKALYNSDDEKHRNYINQYFEGFFDGIMTYHSVHVLDRKENFICPTTNELMDIKSLDGSMKIIEKVLRENNVEQTSEHYPFNFLYMNMLKYRYPCPPKE